MGELDRRRDELAAADDDAALGVLGYMAGAAFGPAGVIVAIFVGPYAKLALRRLREFRARLTETGLDDQAIVDRLDGNPALAHLVADAVRGTVESDVAAKRKLLARAVVRALEEDAFVDFESKYVRAAGQVDTADVRVLAIVAKAGRLTLSAVSDTWPGVAGTLDASVGALTAAGLVSDITAQIRPPGASGTPTILMLTPFGQSFVERLQAAGLDDELAAMPDGGEDPRPT